MARVLLIEPDRILADCYIQFLEEQHHQIVWVSNAQAAVEKCDEWMPDVIVLEPQLALHNGFEIIYELRSYNDFQKIPIIIHSHITATQFADSPVIRMLGIHAYINKSDAKLTDLAQALHNVLATV